MLFRFLIPALAIFFYARKKKDKKATPILALPAALSSATKDCRDLFTQGKLVVHAVIENGSCSDLQLYPDRDTFFRCMVAPAARHFLTYYAQPIPNPTYIGAGALQTTTGDLQADMVAQFVLRNVVSSSGMGIMEVCPFPQAATGAPAQEIVVSPAASAFYADIVGEVSRMMDQINAGGSQ